MVESDSEKESLYIEQKVSAWSYVPEKNQMDLRIYFEADVMLQLKTYFNEEGQN